jgi:general secretion pathway protein I
VLVAFAIAAFLLVAVLRALTTGLDASKRSETYTRAVILAESMLDTMGLATPLTDGDEADLRDGPFRIRATVQRYENAAAPSGVGQYLVLYQLSATVSWREGPREEAVSLQTLRLGRVR